MNILIAGDFAPRARLAAQIEEKKFADIFPENLCSVIKSADFSLVNFESPIAEADFKPISKCGPNLRCTPSAVEAIKYAGFTGVTMANNHILDYGPEGLRLSVGHCKEQGLDYVGVGEDIEEAQKILYLEKEGKTLAVINCCEHEFSIATDTEPGANPLNPVRQYYSILEAKKNADYVLVIVHGGHEHFQLPSLRMKELYRFFIDAGADAVVNHHQHCFSGYEAYNGKPIFYGIGNFCFDINPVRTNSPWNYGYMVKISFGGGKIECELYPFCQYGAQPQVQLLDESSFDEQLSLLNEIIGDDSRLKSEVDKYYSKSSGYELSILEPYSGRIMNKLFSLGLVPRFIKGRKVPSVLNHIDCEAHRDKLIFALKQKNI